jgi:hypothetical protein
MYSEVPEVNSVKDTFEIVKFSERKLDNVIKVLLRHRDNWEMWGNICVLCTCIIVNGEIIPVFVGYPYLNELKKFIGKNLKGSVKLYKTDQKGLATFSNLWIDNNDYKNNLHIVKLKFQNYNNMLNHLLNRKSRKVILDLKDAEELQKLDKNIRDIFENSPLTNTKQMKILVDRVDSTVINYNKNKIYKLAKSFYKELL